MKGPVVTVGGPHGSGKSTYAKALAESLNLRYVVAGGLFRQLAKERGMRLVELSAYAAMHSEIDMMIDEKTRVEAKAGCVVIDAQLGAWIVKEAVKLLLVAPDEVRYRRIAERDRIPISSARQETMAREATQKERYMRYYGINVDDLSIYDLKIDTSLLSTEETKLEIIEAVRRLLAEKKLDTQEC